MIVGINAFNIKSGGGIRQLDCLIKAVLEERSITKVLLVVNDKINNRYKSELILEFFSKNIFYSVPNFIKIDKFFKVNKCELLILPGGINIGYFKPYISISQNMLPFDKEEIKKFPFFSRFKFKILKYLQLKTFNNSIGVIFLHEYAQEKILKHIKKSIIATVIPHPIDISENLFMKYRNFKKSNFNLLYVSDFLPYKNHKNLVEAILYLNEKGIDIKLEIIGRDFGLKKYFDKTFNKRTNYKKNIKFNGFISHTDQIEIYKRTDLFVYPSGCENLPFIILEAMSHGMPIVTSDKGPMNKILKGENIFFNQNDFIDIAKIIEINLLNYEGLKINSLMNFENIKNYSFDEYIKKTNYFINKTINNAYLCRY